MSTIPNHLIDPVRRGSFAEFANLANARAYAGRCVKLHLVVQGDIDADGENGRFWVVLAADAQRLEARGYEII